MPPTRSVLVLALSAAACDEGSLGVSPAAAGRAHQASAGGAGATGINGAAAGGTAKGGQSSGGATAGSGAAGVSGSLAGVSGSLGNAGGAAAAGGSAGASAAGASGAGGGDACDAATPCPVSSAPCEIVSCIGGMCAPSPAADGTPLADQKAGDCGRWVCSAGTPVFVADDADSDDQDACSTITCAAGKATVVQALADGEPCTPGGESVCRGTTCTTLLDVHPAPGTVAPADVPLVLVFAEPMNAASLTVQTAGSACDGAVRYSRDDFATCVTFESPLPQASTDGRTLVFQPAAALPAGRYRLLIGPSVTTAAGAALGHPIAPQKSVWVEPGGTCMGSVLIASAFSTHGAGVALLDGDRLVLHNRGALPVDLYGWSVQVQVEASSPWKVLELHGELASSSAKVVEGLPLTMPGPAYLTFGGKGVVALLSTWTHLAPEQCPSGAARVRDVVGVARPDCDRGAGWSSSTYAERRLDQGCRNTGDPSNDFEVYTPASPAPKQMVLELPSGCACGGIPNNESGTTAEADACALLPVVGATPDWVEASVRHAGRTEAAGPDWSVIAQLGFAPKGSSIFDDGWLFVDATFVRQEGESDIYRAATPTLATQKALSFSVVARFSFDDGATFTYCDADGAGKSPGLDFDPAKLPHIVPRGGGRPPKITSSH